MGDSLLEKLKSLQPTQFENVVFDLMTTTGMRNAVWRTPGSDGGRDIEGEIASIDFSGYYVISRWYVECKRYSVSVDWPTVWEKIAYADNHEADHLLVVTTASLSPQCKSEVSRWNSRRRIPIVRFWDGTNLEQLLESHPAILIKYGLVTDSRWTPASFMSLAHETYKVVDAAYGLSEVENHENAALETACTLTELLSVRLRDAESGNKFIPSPFVPGLDEFRWLTITGNKSELSCFDRHGLRALLTILRNITRSKSLNGTVSRNVLRLALPERMIPNTTGSIILNEVALWGDFELLVEAAELIVTART